MSTYTNRRSSLLWRSRRARRKGWWPLAIGGSGLRAWANAQVPRVPVLDRSVSMLVPPLDESPCFHHHPYGIMSELHVQIGLQALLC